MKAELNFQGRKKKLTPNFWIIVYVENSFKNLIMQIKQWLKGLQAIWPLLHLQHPAFTASYYSYSSILEALYYLISKDSLVVFV